ncbi:MAG: DUF5808 domain-containing protein [Ktedonobacteraceae bacterium]|nr:DUF5808 domain-containing protein [Chloroflexota bacterium]
MNMWLFLSLMSGLLIVLVLVLFWHPQRSRTKASTRPDRWPTSTIFRDDDRYWPGGFLYNNPDDPALFVPKRYGLGWTLNFGHPRSTLFLISILLLLLILLILPILISGTTPIGCHPSGCHPLP